MLGYAWKNLDCAWDLITECLLRLLPYASFHLTSLMACQTSRESFMCLSTCNASCKVKRFSSKFLTASGHWMSLAGEALRKREQNLKVPIHKAPKHSELPYSGVASTVPDNQGFLVQSNWAKRPGRNWFRQCRNSKASHLATLLYHKLSWTWENIAFYRFGSWMPPPLWTSTILWPIAPKAILRSRSRHIILAKRPFCSLKIIHAFCCSGQAKHGNQAT